MSSVVLSTPEFNPNGFLELKAVSGTNFSNLQRRVTRTKTLDGKAVLSDLGYSGSDVEIEIRVDEISQTDLNRLKDSIKFFPLLHLACKEGFFIGTISELTFIRSPLFFTFLVKEKLS